MKLPILGRVAVLAVVSMLLLIPVFAQAQGVPTDSGGYRLVATGTTGTSTTSTGSTTVTAPTFGAINFALPRLGDGWFQLRWMMSPARPNTPLSAHALRERRASR